MKWNYLPEVPDSVRVVVAAFENEDRFELVIFEHDMWWYDTPGYMNMIVQADGLYAWAELPEKPPTKEALAAEKAAWLKANPEHYL